MMTHRLTRVAITLVWICGLWACGNPAKGKPKAEVGDAPKPLEVVPNEAATDPDAATNTRTFKLTDESKIGFTGSKITGSHEGGFEKFEGEIKIVGDSHENASVLVHIDATSLWADNDRLERHLKSSDFFDVEANPKAHFNLTNVEKREGEYWLSGILNLHGVTKSIAFPAKINLEGDTMTVNAEFSINRFDFKIIYAGKPDDLIREEVLIRLDLVAKES